jgi:hypothetical protein
MSYSVIYERFPIILDNSKLKELLHKSPYMNMDIPYVNQKYAKICVAKDLVNSRENVFSVNVLIERK